VHSGCGRLWKLDRGRNGHEEVYGGVKCNGKIYIPSRDPVWLLCAAVIDVWRAECGERESSREHHPARNGNGGHICCGGRRMQRVRSLEWKMSHGFCDVGGGEDGIVALSFCVRARERERGWGFGTRRRTCGEEKRNKGNIYFENILRRDVAGCTVVGVRTEQRKKILPLHCSARLEIEGNVAARRDGVI